MENKPKWRKLKIKPRKVNNVQQHHEDYFLVQSVYMDVLIKKQFYDDVNKQKMPKVNEEITSSIPWHTDFILFLVHIYYTNILTYCGFCIYVPKYVICYYFIAKKIPTFFIQFLYDKTRSNSLRISKLTRLHFKWMCVFTSFIQAMFMQQRADIWI